MLNSGLHFCRKGDSLNRSWKLIFELHAIVKSPPTSFANRRGPALHLLHTVVQFIRRANEREDKKEKNNNRKEGQQKKKEEEE